MSQTSSPPLIDSFGRVHTSLRLSVTDRCNIRCFYCMPETGAEFVPKDNILSFEEIYRLARLLVEQGGVRDIRITGGEPLVRQQVPRLIEMLAGIEMLEDLSLTTNGMLLAEHAQALHEAGLQRLNISLDTLNQEVFKKITRRDGLEKTLQGIDAAIKCGFESVKLNTLAIKGVTESEVAELVRYALGRNVMLRFIEFMPLDTDRAWQQEQVFTGDQLLQILHNEFESVVPLSRPEPSQPAEEFQVAQGRVGIIRSVTSPFCEACNRIRITADGAVRNCLFATSETPLRGLIRAGASDEDLLSAIRGCLAGKAKAHGIDQDGFQPPDRPMYAIGG
ncbi:GTP 3',8-cyclase MoaA [Rubripirellula sp.]|nr:GTP 3',8-cyclase MoaA [Rubripirellula sp.]MDB4634635.1 GTP 3',8-cyclase MoaA [Rubripirellula sp.]